MMSPSIGPSGLRARRRLEADEAAARGGNADRAAAVVGVRQRHDARGDRRRRAAARAAGGVARGSTDCASRRRAPASVVGSRPNSGTLVLPSGTRPAALKRATRVSSCGLGRSTRKRAPLCVGTPATIAEDVLEQERHAAERAVAGRGGEAAAVLVQRPDDGVERRVVLLDARDGLLDQLERRHLLLRHQLGQAEPVVLCVFRECHDLDPLRRRRHYVGRRAGWQPPVVLSAGENDPGAIGIRREPAGPPRRRAASRRPTGRWRCAACSAPAATMAAAPPVGGSGSPPPRIAVLSAFPGELAAVLARMQVEQTVEVAGRNVRVGTLGGTPVVAAMTGIGLVNAATTTQAILEQFPIRGVVVSGVAGSSLNIADVAAVTTWSLPDGSSYPVDARYLRIAEHLADARSVAFERLHHGGEGAGRSGVPAQSAGARRRRRGRQRGSLRRLGVPLSRRQRRHLRLRRARIPPPPPPHRCAPPAAQQSDTPLIQDMESAAIARAAAAKGVPFIAFRAVSDGAGDPLDLHGFPDAVLRLLPPRREQRRARWRKHSSPGYNHREHRGRAGVPLCLCAPLWWTPWTERPRHVCCAAVADPPHSSRAGWLLALLPLAAFIYFAAQVPAVVGGETLQLGLAWVPSLGIALSFQLDGLSLLFALLISGIGALIVVYAGGYLAGHPQLGRFYALLLLFTAAMLGVVCAGDVITLFVFWELTSISSYLLIGFDHERAAARAAALQALLITGGGGLALLAGLLLLGQVAGGTELWRLADQSAAIHASPLYLPILVLVLAGAFTKSAQVPFHFWLPAAMEAPTPVSAYLHSATMVKAGVYLVARLHPVLGGSPAWHYAITLAGAATMLTGALLALAQRDLKRLLAYSTVSALGTLMLLLGHRHRAGGAGGDALPRRPLALQGRAVHGRRRRRPRNRHPRRHPARRPAARHAAARRRGAGRRPVDGRPAADARLHQQGAALRGQAAGACGAGGWITAAGVARQRAHRRHRRRRRAAPVLGPRARHAAARARAAGGAAAGAAGARRARPRRRPRRRAPRSSRWSPPRRAPSAASRRRCRWRSGTDSARCWR